MEPKLTDKQRVFIDEYLIDLNATQAAIRAGYSKDSAKQIGTENLSKPAIQDAIGIAQAERSERTQIDADWVLTQAVESFKINAAIINDRDGNAVMTNAAAAAKFLDQAGNHMNIGAFRRDFEIKPSTITIQYLAPE